MMCRAVLRSQQFCVAICRHGLLYVYFSLANKDDWDACTGSINPPFPPPSLHMFLGIYQALYLLHPARLAPPYFLELDLAPLCSSPSHQDYFLFRDADLLGKFDSS